MILLKTSHGDITLELDYDKAPRPPKTLSNMFATDSMMG